LDKNYATMQLDKISEEKDSQSLIRNINDSSNKRSDLVTLNDSLFDRDKEQGDQAVQMNHIDIDA